MKKLQIFTDGGARGNPGMAGGGAIVEVNKTLVLSIGWFFGGMTNNESEYTALLKTLDEIIRKKATNVELDIYMDSDLIVQQINGRYKVKKLELKILHEKVHARLDEFTQWTLQHISREKNRRADKNANIAMDTKKDFVILDILK